MLVVAFPTGLLLPIFFRKNFKKFWQRLFENGYWFCRVSRRFIGSDFRWFPPGLLLPIFFRKKFKKFWQRLFENGYCFDSFRVYWFMLLVCLELCFFQFFSEKNLKNFGRGFSKMVIGFEEFPVGLLVLT